MYRRPKFLEKLLEIRREMARDADYDVDLFVEMTRSGSFHEHAGLDDDPPHGEFHVGDAQEANDASLPS